MASAPWDVIIPALAAVTKNESQSTGLADFLKVVTSTPKRGRGSGPGAGNGNGRPKKKQKVSSKSVNSHSVTTSTTKKKKSTGSKKVSFKKQVKKNLERLNELSAMNGIRKYRRLDYGAQSWTHSACSYLEQALWRADVFDTSMASLPHFNRGTAGTVGVDESTSSSTVPYHTVHIKNLRTEVTIRNNDDCPFEVRTYWIRATHDTSIDFVNAFQAIDDIYKVDSTTNPCVYPTEFNVPHWKVISSGKHILAPGAEAFEYMNEKEYLYKVRTNDVVASTYQKGDVVFVTRCVGRICRGVTNPLTEVGTSVGRAHFQYKRYWEVHFPSDGSFRDFGTSNTGRTTVFTGGAICTTHDVEENNAAS